MARAAATWPLGAARAAGDPERADSASGGDDDGGEVLEAHVVGLGRLARLARVLGQPHLASGEGGEWRSDEVSVREGGRDEKRAR
jgi:hypothetical protein